MQRENSEFNASGDIGDLPLRNNPTCLAKSAVGRHTILKKGLTRPARAGPFRPNIRGRTAEISLPHGIFAKVIRLSPIVSNNAAFMTFFTAAYRLTRKSRRYRRDHMLPLVAAGAIATCAIALVAYLLWPTWGAEASNGPDRLPISIGGTLFNVPVKAIRMKI